MAASEEGKRQIQVVRKEIFDVGPRYSNLSYIGRGGFGMVVSAVDTVKNEDVAIKKISLSFDGSYGYKCALREIRLLTFFKHENIIAIKDIIRSPNIDSMNEIYIVQCRMETDLCHILQGAKLTSDHVCHFMYQILKALKYIHSANVFHRDLKPDNILVNASCDLKICDFGLSRIVDPEYDHTSCLTENITTLWYSAPEMMFNAKGYTKAVDVWSTGCILAEMLSNKPIFPADHYVDLLNRIVDVIGFNPNEDMTCVITERARNQLQSIPTKPKVSWERLFPNVCGDALDLLDKMLIFNPEKRITADEALAEPYLAQYHNINDEPVMDKPFKFEMELSNLSEERLKELLFEEAAALQQQFRTNVP